MIMNCDNELTKNKQKEKSTIETNLGKCVETISIEKHCFLSDPLSILSMFVLCKVGKSKHGKYKDGKHVLNG